MEKYTPPFTITNQMLSYVASISEKIGRISFVHDLESFYKYIFQFNKSKHVIHFLLPCILNDFTYIFSNLGTKNM